MRCSVWLIVAHSDGHQGAAADDEEDVDERVVDGHAQCRPVEDAETLLFRRPDQLERQQSKGGVAEPGQGTLRVNTWLALSAT